MKSANIVKIAVILLFFIPSVSMAGQGKNVSGKGKYESQHGDRDYRGGGDDRGSERYGEQATMSIMGTRNTLMTAAAITGTTSTIGNNTNTGAIGAHGMIGTGMPRSIPAFTSMGTITVTRPT